MHTQALRGVPARNCDAVKHSLPVQLDPRDVPSSSLLATSLVSHAAFFPSHSIPSQHYSLIFSSPILAAISFFFFSPHFYSHSLEWHCTPSCSPVMCYPFFSDGNSSRTLSSSFQFQFSALCIKRTQGVLASS